MPPAFTFTVRRIVDQTTALTLGSRIDGSVGAGQTNRYTFSLSAPTTVYFDNLVNNSNLGATVTAVGASNATPGNTAGAMNSTAQVPVSPRIITTVPQFTFAFTPRSAARSTLGGLHRWSVLWYKRSHMYRRWRARRDVSQAIERICIVLDPATA